MTDTWLISEMCFRLSTRYGSDPGNNLMRKRREGGGFSGLNRAFWGLKLHLLGDRDAKSEPLLSSRVCMAHYPSIHKREFLLKFARDRRRWLQWLGEAKKRFGVSILNYAVTCNHIHLLIKDDQWEEVIPQTMQLIAGRTGQEHTRRKPKEKA